MTRTELQEMCDEANAKVSEILSAPTLPDPAAPAGYLTIEYAALDRRRRFVAARDVIERLLRTIGERCGPAAEASVRDHFAPMLAMLEAMTGPLH